MLPNPLRAKNLRLPAGSWRKTFAEVAKKNLPALPMMEGPSKKVKVVDLRPLFRQTLGNACHPSNVTTPSLFSTNRWNLKKALESKDVVLSRHKSLKYSTMDLCWNNRKWTWFKTKRA